jgi:hypothetical protein
MTEDDLRKHLPDRFNSKVRGGGHWVQIEEIRLRGVRDWSTGEQILDLRSITLRCNDNRGRPFYVAGTYSLAFLTEHAEALNFLAESLAESALTLLAES